LFNKQKNATPEFKVKKNVIIEADCIPEQVADSMKKNYHQPLSHVTIYNLSLRDKKRKANLYKHNILKIT
jgi:hypothetical protein